MTDAYQMLLTHDGVLMDNFPVKEWPKDLEHIPLYARFACADCGEPIRKHGRCDPPCEESERRVKEWKAARP